MTALWHMLARVSPVLVDALMVFLYVDAVSWMNHALFQSESTAAGWFVMSFFALLTIGVFVLRFLESREKAAPAIFGYPALGFAILVLLIAIQALGVLDGTPTISDTQGGVLTIVFVILAGLYVAGALGALPAETKKDSIHIGTARFFFLQLFSLLTIALAIILAGAYWELLIGGEGATEGARSFEDKILTLLWAYPIFLLFFASPRLLFLTKSYTWHGSISAFASIGYYVWVSLNV